MEEKEEYIKLFDIYNELLTDKQRHIFKLYFMCDLSLREIASNENVTFQAIADCIKKTQKQLTRLENAVKMYEYKTKVTLVKKQLNKLDIENSKLNKLLEEI